MSLTREQKLIKLHDHCDKQHHCDPCELKAMETPWCNYDTRTIPDEVIDSAYELIAPPKPIIEEPEPIVHDVVNHPDHYCREGAMECIDEMVTLFGKEAVKHFCLCNLHKYRYRASLKNGEEDLKKSDFYMRKYQELC